MKTFRGLCEALRSVCRPLDQDTSSIHEYTSNLIPVFANYTMARPNPSIDLQSLGSSFFCGRGPKPRMMRSDEGAILGVSSASCSSLLD